jgi:cell division protein ZapA (FtsZ GTPase activity inhibitor)
MSAVNTLDIKLHGKEFRVACTPADKDDLLAVAAFLDWKMG